MPTVYVTAPREAAPDLARRLIDERLAACVNVVDCESTYRWGSEVHEDEESALFVKTTEHAAEALMQRVDELHPHDVPCVERFDEAAVAGPFGDWRSSVVDAPD